MKFVSLLLTLFCLTAFAAKMTGPTQLDDLFRGEMAAVQAYDIALKDMKAGPERTKLMQIRKEHQSALNKLSKYVANKPSVKEDVETSGPWGSFAKAWVKGGTLINNDAALAALKQGEEHGVDEYKEALEDDNISAQLKKQIRNEMLPAQAKHISTLKALKK